MPSEQITRRIQRRQVTLARRYDPDIVPASEPEAAPEAESEVPAEPQPEPKQEAPVEAARPDTRTVDAPLGLSLQGLENAAAEFRTQGFDSHDQIKGWGDDDGALRRLAVVRRPYATGGVLPPGTSEAVKPTTLVFHHQAEPTEDAVARGLNTLRAINARMRPDINH